MLNRRTLLGSLVALIPASFIPRVFAESKPTSRYTKQLVELNKIVMARSAEDSFPDGWIHTYARINPKDIIAGRVDLLQAAVDDCHKQLLEVAGNDQYLQFIGTLPIDNRVVQMMKNHVVENGTSDLWIRIGYKLTETDREYRLEYKHMHEHYSWSKLVANKTFVYNSIWTPYMNTVYTPNHQTIS